MTKDEEIRQLRETVSRLEADNAQLMSRNMQLSEQLCMWYELRQRVNWLKEEMKRNRRHLEEADAVDDGELLAAIDTRLEQETTLLTGDFGAPELAKLLGVSQARLSRLFRITAYKSAEDYLDFLRTVRGMQLLREHPEYGIVGVSEIAGFRSVRTFQRRMNEAVGMTPVEFRMLSEKTSGATDNRGK